MSSFNDHKVKYLVVSGYAVGFHAQPRATTDLDLFIEPDLDNGKAVYAAPAKFGAPLVGLTPDDFIQRGAFFRMGRPPLIVEIFPEIKGVDFDAAWERRIETLVDTDTGLKAFLISRDDLMAAKLAAARPQDLADVDAIRKTAATKAGSSKKHPGTGQR
ncbi:MAG: DUF6036 family nucleotidyltransferase [Bryobacteraceae bacterium]